MYTGNHTNVTEKLHEIQNKGRIKGGLLDQLYREAKVESVEYGETVDVVAVCTPRIIGQLKDYIEGWTEPKEEWE